MSFRSIRYDIDHIKPGRETPAVIGHQACCTVSIRDIIDCANFFGYFELLRIIIFKFILYVYITYILHTSICMHTKFFISVMSLS